MTSVTIGYMLARHAITTDTLVHQHSKQFALKGLPSRVGPVDYIGKVCEVSTDESGSWFFRVRYIHRPGTSRTGAKYWSERLYEEDLCHFEPITLDKVMEWLAVGARCTRGRPRKAPRLPAWMQPPTIEKEIPQLRLYDDCQSDEVSGWV